MLNQQNTNTSPRLLDFIKPYRLWIALAPILMTLEVVMNLMQPRLLEQIIDQGIAKLNLQLVIHTGIWMVVTSIIGAFGGMSNGVFAEMTSQGFGMNLREALFRKVQGFSFGNLDVLDTGQLITRLTNDVTQVMEAIVQLLRILVRAPLLLIGSLVMSIITSPKLAFLPLVLMPIELVVVIWIINRATPIFTIVQQKLDALNEVMQENLAGMRVVKAFVRAVHEIRRFGSANDQLTAETIRAGRTVIIMQPFMMITINLGIVCALWFGGVRVIQGTMTVGEIVAFVNYLSTTLFSLMMVSQLVIQMARARASAQRIQQVLDTEPIVQDKLNAYQPASLKGQVIFEKVAFSYDHDGGSPVLKEINFTAEPGQTIAILGTTGAGKSSLVHLIPRFYDANAGSIKVGGYDVRDLDLQTLRRSIGIALQETVLFSGTIADNIRYGQPDASMDDVINAAKVAQAHDFIQSMPEGYNTILGQRGVNLSGGQKQRLAIARAILIKPTILILDDSTSAVDVETEIKIQEALKPIMKNHTSFIIAQRISTVLNADKILVLDDGQVKAEGTHQDLMATSPIYREIYESQLGRGVLAHE